MRLGLSTTLGCWAVDPEIVAAVEAAAGRLEAAGATVDEVDPGFRAEDEAAWMVLWAVFMAAYYGDVLEEFRDRMDPQVVALIETGRQVSAPDYKRIELVRTDMWRRLRPILADPRRAAVPDDGRCRRTRRRRPRPAGARRVDADGLHVGRHDGGVQHGLAVPGDLGAVRAHTRPADAGLPIGLQVVGRRWREDTVLRIARAVELISIDEVSRRRARPRRLIAPPRRRCARTGELEQRARHDLGHVDLGPLGMAGVPRAPPQRPCSCRRASRAGRHRRRGGADEAIADGPTLVAATTAAKNASSGR